MPAIIACPCGTKLKSPANPAVKAIKCPKCNKVLRVAAAPATAAPKGAPPPVKRVAPPPPPVREEEEVEVNEAVDEEEVVINEAVDDEPAPKKAKKSAHGLKLVEEGADPFAGLDIPEKLQEGLRAEVGKKEKIVWVGRPDVALMLAQARPAVFIGVGLFVVALGLLLSLAFVQTESIFVTVRIIAGILVLLLSIPFMLATILLEKFQTARACYVLTNRRAIVFNSGFGTRSYTGSQLLDMERQESKRARFKGYGDLVFEVETTWENMGSGRNERAVERKQNHGFLQIAQVRAVEKLLRETLIDNDAD